MELLIEQLSTLAHPQRMALFRMLVRRCPDYVSAGDIATALELKASTASAHLARLTRAGLITQARQGTSLRYQLNTDGAEALMNGLFNDCCRGRPDLCAPFATTEAAHSASNRRNVLFVCSGNSARSIFAEAILRHIAPEQFDVFSAGTTPYSEINPSTIKTLRANGVPTEGLSAKSIDALRSDQTPEMDFVITVCDQAANTDSPNWRGQPLYAHWGLPDPVHRTSEQDPFQATYLAIRHRLDAFAKLPFAQLDRAGLQNTLDTLAQDNPTP